MIWLSKKRNLLFMLLPTVVLYACYVLLPIAISFYYSLTKFSGIGKPKFIGFGNFARLLGDDYFWISLKNTLIVLGVEFVFLLPAAFAVALLLNKSIKGVTALKAINFSPMVIAPILVGLVFVFILDPHMGFLNMLMKKAGLDAFALPWIGGKALSPYSIGFVHSWQTLGLLMTIFLAGLKMIPKDVYESSSIDGATAWQQLRYITVPMMNESFKIGAVLIITGVFKIFEIVIQLTGGGPNHLSETLVTYMYSMTFANGQYGYGMALAVVTFLLAVAFSAAYLLMSRKNIEA